MNKTDYRRLRRKEAIADHDEGETLHAFRTHCPGGITTYGRVCEVSWMCAECGDTEEGLMHNNTDRNIEPLLSDVEY